MSSQPSEWAKIIAADGFAQISTTGKKVRTKDCTPIGKYPVIDQGQEKVAGYVNDSEKLISVTEPLIVFGDHTRAVKWVDFSFVPGADGTKILQPKPYLLPRFAYHQLGSLEIPNKGYARHFKFLKELGFGVPPLAEQKVIADKLDTLLAQVENIKARLERIPKILKRFRQSVLAGAVSGRLTEDWRIREGLLSASSIGEIDVAWESSYRAEGKQYRKPNLEPPENEPKDIPRGWIWTQIGYVFDVHIGATPSRKEPSYWGGEVNWVSSAEVAFCRIKSTKEKITEKGLANASTILHPPGTVMLAMIGQGKTRGQPAILDSPACHNQNTAALRVLDKICVPEFLYYFLYERYEETRRVGSGNNQQAMNKKVVQTLPFPLPPHAEQVEIVGRVDQLFAQADRIEQQVNNALARVKNLTQSILAKAFRGELTAQWREENPELIGGENSAETLLERIKAEREVKNTAKLKSRRLPAQ